MNPVKNEYTIKLGDEEILLRPHFENLASLENNVGSISYLGWLYGRQYAQKDLTIEDKIKRTPPLTTSVEIIYWCQASRKPDDPNQRLYSKEEIFEKVLNTVGVRIKDDIILFLGQAGAGGKKASKEAEDTKSDTGESESKK